MSAPKTFSTQSDVENAVRDAVDDAMPTIKAAIQEFHEPLRAQLVRLIAPALTAVILFAMLQSGIGGWTLGVALAGAVVWLLYEGYQAIKLYEKYTKAFDREVYKAVFATFGIEAKHVKDNKDELLAELNTSELLTETVHSHRVDDDFDTEYEGQPLSVTELHATRQEGSGKNRRTVTVFKGIFVAHKLPTTLKGETYVSTEGDKYGFGHRNFFANIVGKEAVEETEFEWNEFEKDLHVASSDPTEARYILTPDFMHELYDWWKEEKRNIRISFKESHCYVLFPDRKISLGAAPLRIDRARVNDYATTIAIPLWHVFNLLEDVRTRFR